MSVHEDILQGVRAWAKATLGLTDAQIVPATRGVIRGPAPQEPYLTVSLPVLDLPYGVDEKEFQADGWHHKGIRTGIVAMEGFGEGAAEWIQDLNFRVDEIDDPLTLVTRFALVDLTSLVEDVFEFRYAQDFVVDYALSPDSATGTDVAAATVSLDLEFEGSDLALGWVYYFEGAFDDSFDLSFDLGPDTAPHAGFSSAFDTGFA